MIYIWFLFIDFQGELDGRKGIIRRQCVRFKEKTTAEKLKKLGKGVNLQLVPIYLCDGTKMMLAISPKVKVKELREQIIEKIELQDPEFFDLADSSIVEGFLHLIFRQMARS